MQNKLLYIISTRQSSCVTAREVAPEVTLGEKIFGTPPPTGSGTGSDTENYFFFGIPPLEAALEVTPEIKKFGTPPLLTDKLKTLPFPKLRLWAVIIWFSVLQC